MITCMSDSYWQTPLPAGSDYAPWLGDRGSLTLRIQQRCSRFSVENLCSGLAAAAHDETALLGLTAQQKLYTREVFLHADGMAVVFAHSVTIPRHLHGAWHPLLNLGKRPLGEFLFTHPRVLRAPLHYHALKPGHALYRRAASKLKAAPPQLWARRSLFTLNDAPLLVTEVFLPDILKLQP